MGIVDGPRDFESLNAEDDSRVSISSPYFHTTPTFRAQVPPSRDETGVKRSCGDWYPPTHGAALKAFVDVPGRWMDSVLTVHPLPMEIKKNLSLWRNERVPLPASSRESNGFRNVLRCESYWWIDLARHS
ncbi:hypothetical protein TNCV_1119161 [Trichonephila clavipes]|uniref:Uncharacterized protein n=1 Tax=Trichonephila clavipes TaxID=2585209 RepID=A0A8X6T3N2_TRICX|nr:hypothetical protein TNCV_1119161 [Trichonephila clavipes]